MRSQHLMLMDFESGSTTHIKQMGLCPWILLIKYCMFAPVGQRMTFIRVWHCCLLQLNHKPTKQWTPFLQNLHSEMLPCIFWCQVCLPKKYVLLVIWCYLTIGRWWILRIGWGAEKIIFFGQCCFIKTPRRRPIEKKSNTMPAFEHLGKKELVHGKKTSFQRIQML